FNTAMDARAFHDAVARIGAVAPFFPDFVPPVGWQAAPHTPIPIDFIPPEGMKLVVPPSVIIPDGMILPDTFEPVNPPGPGPDPEPGTTHHLYDGDDVTARPQDERFVIHVDIAKENVIKIDKYLETQIIDLSRI